jgi:hypothetical protein
MLTEHIAEVRVHRYSNASECDVIVRYRDREMWIRCRDYNQAVQRAKIECRSYKDANGFTVEPRSTESTEPL